MLLRLARANNAKGWEAGTFLEAKPDSHSYSVYEMMRYEIIKISDKDFKLLNLERLKHKLDTSNGIIKYATDESQHVAEVSDGNLL